MAVVNTAQRPNLRAWGWSILMVLCTFLVVNGLWLFFAVGSASVFEQDTGVSLSDLQAAYPSVATVMERRGQTIAMLLTGLGLLAFIVSFTGLRTASAWAWTSLWVLVLLLGVIALRNLTDGVMVLGFYYLALAVVALTGLLLANRPRSRP